MRCPLLLLALVASISSSAQFKADLIAAGGLTMPKLHKELAPHSNSRTGDYFSTGADFMFSTSHKLFPYAGVRISHHGFRYTEEFANGTLDKHVDVLALSILAGVQYRQALGEHTALRFAAGAGGFSGGEDMANESNISGVGEASVGFQWHSLTLGLKLVKPLSSYRERSGYALNVRFEKGEGFNNYRMQSVAVELKLTPRPPSGMPMRERPARSIRRGPRGYESAKEHNARVELGIAAGPAMVKVTDRGWYDSSPAGSGAIGLLMFDVYGDGNKRPICFAAGARVGSSPLGFHIIHVGGFQINPMPEKDLGIRVSAMGGPIIYGREGTIKFNLVLEGNASVLINHRWSVGLKYMQPIEDLTDIYYREPEYGSDYRVRYLMGEVKLRFGKR
ncbi:hypothetical protein [Polluticoccus soli]|uniref:hypothetical protein n=1 Tax=Polluticoccus soli TaxID=3034150 RepID=UPI0023E0D845|nr:hypothetical protein [Flavipsychrobacter sp. JY13-12]